MEDMSVMGRPGATRSFGTLMLIGAVLAGYAGVSLLLAPSPGPTRGFPWSATVANLIAFPCLAGAMWLLPRAYPQMPATVRWARWMSIAGFAAGFALTIVSAITAAT